MSTSEETSRRYASDRSGVIHEVVRFLPRREVYVALCGAQVPTRTAEVWRATQPPGVLCAACRDSVPSPSSG